MNEPIAKHATRESSAHTTPRQLKLLLLDSAAAAICLFCSPWHQINLTRPPAALYAGASTAADATYLVRDAINVIQPPPLKY
jgi:hypothetical protein